MSPHLLPQHLIEVQLAQIDLLLAMYPDEGTIKIDGTSSQLLQILRTLEDGQNGNTTLPDDTPAVSLLLALNTTTEDGTQNQTFQVEILLPFTHDPKNDPQELDEPPHPKVRLLQPSWMNKADAAAIMVDKPQNEDLFTRIEQIKDAVTLHLSTSSKPDDIPETFHQSVGPLVRVWFYFPSISTRSKRDDIVNYAPAYHLTGFLLSGKPGVLCLEGSSERVDAYMKFIKTESWGDIPAHHKKVTERLREDLGRGESGRRVFADMQEITDTLGERRGERSNRGDMKLLEAWLGERGLGDALMKVLT